MTGVLSFINPENPDLRTPLVFQCSFSQEGQPVWTKQVNKTKTVYIDIKKETVSSLGEDYLSFWGFIWPRFGIRVLYDVLHVRKWEQ